MIKIFQILELFITIKLDNDIQKFMRRADMATQYKGKGEKTVWKMREGFSL